MGLGFIPFCWFTLLHYFKYHIFSAPLLSPVLGGDLLQLVTMVGDQALLVVKNNDIYYLVGQPCTNTHPLNYSLLSQICPRKPQYAWLILDKKGWYTMVSQTGCMKVVFVISL